MYCVGGCLLVPLQVAVVYLFSFKLSSVPAWVDVVRSSFEGDNPLLDLFPPLIPLVHLVIEGETGVPIVHLFTAETLVSRYEGLASHLLTGTVVWLGVVVVRHLLFLLALLLATLLVASLLYQRPDLALRFP